MEKGQESKSVTLQDKTIFITGATSGFGRSAALLLAQHGARLVLTGRRTERLESLRKELKNRPVHLLTLDVRDNAQVERAIKNLPKEFSDIYALINNAGLAAGMEPAQEARLDNWEQMVDTNIKGLIYCTRAALPGMVARDSGHIINIGSTAGNYPYPGGNVYGGTKAFVKQFSLNLRADLIGKNIRVTNIEPGMASGTEFSLVRLGDKEKADAVYKGIEALSPEDVAEAILWALTRPAHVNVNRIELMPVMQAFSPFAVHRKE